MSDAFLTPLDVARRLNLKKVDAVYGLIRQGALAASNVSPSAGRPCWRIAPEAFDQFVKARQAAPAPKSVRRRRVSAARVTEYFRAAK
jgi:hypothetical protein